MCAVLANKQENSSFKSAPKVVFTLYKGAVGSLELAQKGKVVKNFEKKKDFWGASWAKFVNKFIEIINKLFSNFSTV